MNTLTLHDLLPALLPAAEGLTAYPALVVRALSCDSRTVDGGTLFFCLVGKRDDGHRFAAGAYRAGCRMFVVERQLELPPDAVQVVVPDTRAALADAAAVFYGHPEREVRLIGLTGTKGKTTTALLIRHLLESAGIPTGYIGTNGVDYGGHHEPTRNSTPESLELYRILRGMADAGMEACALEVSSQALWMGRTRGLRFDTTLFTNLSRDHIGGVEHPDMAHYTACKRALFADYPTGAVVINRDDGASVGMLEGLYDPTVPVLPFSLRADGADGSLPAAVFSAEAVRPARRGGQIGMAFRVQRQGKTVPADGVEWFLPLPGRFNVQNALAAVTVACERFGISPEAARAALAVAHAEGRFETVTHPALPDVTFVIDYAHNGVSLSAILEVLCATEPERLIALFGSVGGRTQERRRDLALAAAAWCDLCILTSDNPADEPPMDILHEIDAAFPAGACPRVLIPDREAAIRYAVEHSRPGDIILLAGKGHEDYQLIGREKVPFSERAILEEALEARAMAGAL